jgi:UDP-N-acetylglucosamine/UDP-N-acetylgalactosamine 4-epimerase
MTRYDDVKSEIARMSGRATWLVTGGAGFIGSHLVETLLALGQSVRVLDNFATGSRRNLFDRAELVEGDLADADTCARACKGAHYVLHQGALGSVPRSLADPIASHRANVDGFLHILLAARDAGVRRFVYASSSSVYGDHEALPKVEGVIGKPLSPYATTKLVDEIYARTLQDAYGVETVGLRYFNVFGARQDPGGPYAAVIPRWVASLLRGEPCTIYGDGETSRDFCFVDNAVQANLLAAMAPSSSTNHVYNVACGERTTLSALFASIRDGLAAMPDVVRARPTLAHEKPLYGPFRPGDVRHSLADIAKARAQLGYAPTHDVAAGLAQALTWYVANARASGSTP